MKDIGARAIQIIRDNINSKNINTTGRTANSLQFEDTFNRLIIYSDNTGAPISTLQYGREGGKIPINFVGIIKQWIIDKGITVQPIPFSKNNPRPNLRKYSEQERGINKMAYFTAKKIAKEGTERHKNNRDDIYTPAIEFVIDEFEKRHTDAIINEFLK